MICDVKARPLGLVLSPGQASDSQHLQRVLDSVHRPSKRRGRPRKRPDCLVLDKGYSYPACRQLLRRRGIKALIPERKDQRGNRLKKGSDGGRPCRFDKALYRERNVVERCILRLKQFRRVATRYDKRASNYLAVITIATILLWLR